MLIINFVCTSNRKSQFGSRYSVAWYDGILIVFILYIAINNWFKKLRYSSPNHANDAMI